MKVPPLYNAKKGKVVKLKRPIYELKQSGRSRNEEINVFLTKNSRDYAHQVASTVKDIGRW